MTNSRLALVADDLRLGNAIRAHLKKSLRQTASVSKFGEIRQHLSADPDEVLILASASSAGVQATLHVAQEVTLQKRQPVIIVSSFASPNDSKHLDRLDSYVAGRLSWPDDASRLPGLVREQLGRRSNFAGPEKSTKEVIASRLLSLTPSLLPILDRIVLAGSHDMTVLISGETGTGKTYLAKLIHECSPRKGDGFLVVPCGALAANLVESEFFGHVKGAFTGAERDKIGKFAAAGKGTLLLDEIDALGLEQQTNLLRVIETGEFEPVGSNETQVCKARIIVASNWNLEKAMAEGKFRRDLYYRLNAMSFLLPPLHERSQDIAPLVRGLTARFNKKFHKDLFEISTGAMAALQAFAWPGNIRQLENVVQHAVLVSTGPILTYQHLPQSIQDYAPSAHASNSQVSVDSLLYSRELAEKSTIQRTLMNNGFRRTSTAKALGISRVTLYKKMRIHGMLAAGDETRKEQPLDSCAAPRR